MKSYFILWGKRNLGNLLRKAGENMKERYNSACAVLEEAKKLAEDTSTSLDQALQAMEIVALLELREALESIDNGITEVNDSLGTLGADLELLR